VFHEEELLPFIERPNKAFNGQVHMVRHFQAVL